MRKGTAFFLILMIIVVFSFSADINFYGGLKGLFNSVNINYKDTSIDNKINLSSLSFGGKVEIDETYYFSLYFGLTTAKFSESIVFDKIPFSVKLPDNTKKGYYFNFDFHTYPFEMKGIEFGIGINADMFMLKKSEWDISLPIVFGKFESNINSYNFNLNLLARGEIFNGFTLYGGPSLLKILGNIKGVEQINNDLSGEENKNFSNKKLIGIFLGFDYEVEDYLMISTEIHLINCYGLMVSLNYIF
jgi:hypothetical protein